MLKPAPVRPRYWTQAFLEPMASRAQTDLQMRPPWPVGAMLPNQPQPLLESTAHSLVGARFCVDPRLPSRQMQRREVGLVPWKLVARKKSTASRSSNQIPVPDFYFVESDHIVVEPTHYLRTRYAIPMRKADAKYNYSRKIYVYPSIGLSLSRTLSSETTRPQNCSF